MRAFVWLLVGVLLVFQQDYWNWNNETLVFGFLPFTLAYQCVISIATAIIWIFAVQYCWPKDLMENESLPEGRQS